MTRRMLCWCLAWVCLGCKPGRAPAEGGQDTGEDGATSSEDAGESGTGVEQDLPDPWTPPPPCAASAIVETQSLMVTSQAELDALTGVCGFEGELRIDGDDITSLAPLADLQWVRGYLSLTEAPGLTSLEPLTNLQYVAGGPTVRGGDTSLADLHGLDHLVRVSTLYIASVPSVEGLPAQLAIGEWQGEGWSKSVQIANIEGLTSLAQLPTLTPDYESGSEGMSLTLDRLPQLASLAGVEALLGAEPARVSLQLEQLPLTDLSGLEGLDELRSLGLVRMDQLESLSGAGQLAALEVLTVHATALESFAGLDALASLELLQLGRECVDDPVSSGDNPGLVDFVGLEGVESLAMVVAGGQSGLTSLAGLPCAESINLRYNAALEDQLIADYLQACAIELWDPSAQNCGNGGQGPCPECPPN